MNAIPFTIDAAFGVFGECTGLLRDDGSHLSLEFESWLFWCFNTGIRKVAIPTSEVAEVIFAKHLFSASIVIQSSRLETVRDVPGANQGRIELKIERKHRDAAEKFVAGLYRSDAGATP
jgi:hypothetical protein